MSGSSRPPETFPKSVRLRRTRDYRRVQGRGRRLRTRHILVLYEPGSASGSRFGITVSRKVGNSVTRNRVKRWLRESIRQHRSELRGTWDVVFIANPRASSAGQEAITSEVCFVFHRLGEGTS